MICKLHNSGDEYHPFAGGVVIPQSTGDPMQLYQLRDSDGMYPSADGFNTIEGAVAFIKFHLYEDVPYFIVNRVSDATVAIYFENTVFVPRHKDHWSVSETPKE